MKVDLPPDQWNVVVATLDELPGKFGRKIANEIERQLAEEIKAEASRVAEESASETADEATPAK